MRHLICITISLLLLGTCSPVSAEELWVRNRPFKGQTQGQGNSMKVELKVLAKALDLELDIQNGQVVFGDYTVPIETTADGTEMVLLSDLATGAGFKVKKNPELGTIDVYSVQAGTGEKGDWSASTSSSGSSGRGQTHEGQYYSIKVPSSLEFTNDPAVMAALKQYAGAGRGGEEAGFEFVLQPKNGSNEAVMMMVRMGDLPPMADVPQEVEMAIVEGFEDSIKKRGGTISAGPIRKTIGGKSFVKYEHSETKGSEKSKMESYIHLAGASGNLFLVIISDRPNSFNSSAPQFRKALQSLKIK